MYTTCRLLIIVSLVFANVKSIHCNDELVYVSPNPPNSGCHDGFQCQTLKSYFNNETFTQQSVNLTMIFLAGQHEGGGQKISLKSTSFTIRGTGQLEVVVKDVNIELQFATEIYLRMSLFITGIAYPLVHRFLYSRFCQYWQRIRLTSS